MRGMGLQVVVQKTDGTIRYLANVVCIVNEIVDLGSDGFTCNTENLALSSSKKVCWSRLQRIVGIVDLFGKIIRIVHVSTLLPNRVPAHGNLIIVVLPFLLCFVQMVCICLHPPVPLTNGLYWSWTYTSFGTPGRGHQLASWYTQRAAMMSKQCGIWSCQLAWFVGWHESSYILNTLAFVRSVGSSKAQSSRWLGRQPGRGIACACAM